MTNLPTDYDARVYAGILGKLIGVYLGRPFEGWGRRQIEETIGEVNYYVHQRFGVPLVITDDDISGTFIFPRAFDDNNCPYDITPKMVADVWLAQKLFPGFDPGAQFISELGGPAAPAVEPGYGFIWRHAYFRTMVPVGFINYGGMVAMQTLWAGPWMIKVAGYTPAESAAGLFAINLSMLTAFWLWGVVNPHLARRGVRPEDLIAWGLPISFGVLAAIVGLGADAGWPLWAAFCVSSTFVALSQPAVALALPPQAAGRALSAYNLAIFAGVFVVQWGIGLLIDALTVLGWSEADRFRGAVALFGLCCVAAYAAFWRGWRRSARTRAATLRA